MRLALAFACLATPAVAQEYVNAYISLSDENFYRLVACAAPPGGDCQKRFVRWSRRDARDISVALVQVDDRYPAAVERKVRARLEATLAEINASGANLRLTLAEADETPDIRIFLLNLPRDSAVTGTGLDWFDGNILQAARFQLGWRADGTITECAIAFSRDVQTQAVRRLLLEEIVQCLGLMTDIGGRHYERLSIFSETGDAQEMGKQDLMALRRHYP